MIKCGAILSRRASLLLRGVLLDTNCPKPLTFRERERMIGNLIWTFGLEGITITREQAEAALDRALEQPLLEF